MNKYLLDAKLAHLSEAEVDDLVSRYYKGEKMTPLLAEFNIQCRPQAFAGILPFVLHGDQECPNCGAQMGVRMYSKSSYRQSENELECCHCEHKESPRCRCNCCQKLKKSEELNRQQKQKDSIKKYTELFECWSLKQKAEQLTFRTAVSLLALVRTGELKSDGSYGSISNNPIPFAPNGSMSEAMVALLMNDKLIGPSENSTQRAFTIEDGVITSLDINLVDWKLHCENPELLISEIEDYGLNGNWSDCWSDEEVGDLRLELALAECKEFYEYCLSERSFHYVDGPAINNLLLNLLRDYSVANCYYFIWKGAQQASDYKIRMQVSSRHAANYMSGASLRWADKARSEGWEIKSFSRNYNLPRSMLSYVLYDVMLKIGEKGFTEPLSNLNASPTK
ncbi:MAG: hypothetical protein HOP21_08845 [Methylotenera sp.]|nr:hypothetical protein [Methylotenera sp.]